MARGLPLTPFARVPNRNKATRLSVRTMSSAISSALSEPMELKSSNPSRAPKKMPKLVYGTAWKKERTADLVYQALKQGFRGIDTAAQPRHYQENLVGDGIRRAISDGLVTRDALYLQTKFTPLSGQDKDNMPYQLSQGLADRVHSSVASSLSNFEAFDKDDRSYIDCLVLHSPLPTLAETFEVWRTLETYVPSRIRALGISNVDLDTVASLTYNTIVPPSVVQNRFYPATRWEVDLRKFCQANNIIYQSFWTLSGNPHLVRSPRVLQLAQDAGVEKEVALYALVIGLGRVAILDGTTNPEHMKEDLRGLEDVAKWAQGEGKEKWEIALQGFKEMIGQFY